MLKAKKILIISASVLSILIIGSVIYAYSLLSHIKQTDINKPQISDKDSGIEEYIPLEKIDKKESGITNIALFGLDRRGSEKGRSDTIMILTIDKDNKKIKLTSLMRDMYVNIPGKWDDRINAAYAYGGPGLAINTINQNFDLDIQYYATVDFKGLSRLIDKLGGVDIDVKEGEIKYLNGYLNELNSIDKEDQAPQITSSGLQHLNGKQAVGYMRIRYYGNADFERTERQRTVLNELFEKTKKAGVLKIPDLISTILPYVETNIPKNEILTLSISSLSFAGSIEQYRLPVDGKFNFEVIRGMHVIVPDIKANKEELHNFIYSKS